MHIVNQQQTTKHGFSEYFNTTRGVRQGCPLSPTLFNIYINDIMKSIPREWGVTWKFEYKLNGDPIGINEHSRLGFLFADDLLTMSSTMEITRKICKKVNNWCIKWKMTLNSNKCHIIPVGTTKWKKSIKEIGDVWLDEREDRKSVV
jgi:hypothetical protein